MNQSLLPRTKHSYPMDFSSRNKQKPKQQIPKYSRIIQKINPQQKKQQIKTRQLGELNIHSLRKRKQSESQSIFSSNTDIFQRNLSTRTQDFSNKRVEEQLYDVEKPLKQIRIRNSKIIIDQLLLKNPRFEMNEQKIIKTQQKTLQTLSPKKKALQVPCFGGIKHQNFQAYQNYQSQRQIPLNPQQPFKSLQKNLQKTSLLKKININQPHPQPQINAKKVFIPQSYTYANNFLQGKLQEKQKSDVKRANSSFQIRNHGKIMYVNLNNKHNLQGILGATSTKPLKFNQSGLENKFIQRQHQNRLLLSNRSNFSHFQQQNQRNAQPMRFQTGKISNLKAQINYIAQKRLLNKNAPQSNEKAGFSPIYQVTKQSQQQKSGKKALKKLQINYHLPLSGLKSLSRTYLQNVEKYRLCFKIPRIFTQSTLFMPKVSQSVLHENSLVLFQTLNIQISNLTIKKYSNCIMFINNNIVIIWHFNGKRYLGGWQYHYLDQGTKNGLALEYIPDQYIYYGQFRNNKKHGLGAMKEGPNQLKIGYWHHGVYQGTTNNNHHQHQQQQQQQQYDQLGQSNDQHNNHNHYEQNQQEYRQYQSYYQQNLQSRF